MPPLDESVGEVIREGHLPQTKLRSNEWRLELCSGRHSNFRLYWPGGGIFVKETRPGTWGAEQTLATEAALYGWVAADPGLAGLRPHLPRRIGWQPERRRLLLGDLHPTRSFRAAAWQHGRLDLRRFAQLGRTLARCHAAFAAALEREAPPFAAGLDRELRWLDRLLDPPIALLARIGPGEKKLLEALQADSGLARGLRVSAEVWRPSTLIHHDLKLDNVVFAARAGRLRPILLDWEMAQLGDPAWDLATVLAELLEAWVSSMPLDPGLGAAERERAAERPLPRLAPGARALLAAYGAAAGSAEVERADLVRRALALLPGALVVAIYARQSRVAEPKLAVSAVLLLQLAANILGNPSAAGRRLFGLEAPA